MKLQLLPRRRMVSWVAPILLAIPLAMPTLAMSETDQRLVLLRERASVELLNGTLSLELLKIRGYRIHVRIDGQMQKLKQGESFSPDSDDCSVTFHKVSPETRIARFLTDCS